VTALTPQQAARWDKVLETVTAALPARATAVVVDGADPAAAPLVADRLAETLRRQGLTPQMLDAARAAGRGGLAHLLVADARHLPLRDSCASAIFAAGLITHLPDIATALVELARVTAPGGRLVLFHPSGRAALAARHGRTLRPDEPLHRPRLESLLTQSNWRLVGYDDPPHRFFALATRE
jgi:SAM-dependent methyltransferase